MTETTILQMKGMRKTFDALVALDDVHFELGAREIHGLLGGNGAGKTTLMNVLYGLYRQDSGEVTMMGKKIDIRSPRDAILNGVGMVHQHFLQIPNFSVIHNVILGTPVKNSWTMKLDTEEKKIKDLSQRFGIEIDPRAIIAGLPMGTRQKVEILKALYRGVKVLILDEPTTNLTPQEVDDLFQSLRIMVNEGMSIVFITHKLREVLSVCDRITVLREGRNVLTMDHSEASEETLVKAMVGEGMDVKKSIIFSHGSLDHSKMRAAGKPVLQLEGVSMLNPDGIHLLKKVNLEVREGEIFGIAGVAGNGQRELAEAIVGVRSYQQGSVKLDGAICSMNIRQRMCRGVSYIPEDRLEDGYLPKANVAQNLILGYQRSPSYGRSGFINWNTVFDRSKDLIKEYNIKTSGPGDQAGNLSGGNIQRVMIARSFSQDFRLLVAHNPNRGLDIRSMDFVYEKLFESKNQGRGVLLLSEDLDELLLMCDRIGVMYRGEIVGVLDRPQFEKYQIGRLMSGVKADA